MDVHQEDLELIDKILNGDDSNYKVIVEKHQDYAYTIAYRILNNQQEAEEATQDSFIKAFHALKKFNRESKFTTWLYRIVFNTAITYKRKQKTNVSSIDDTRLSETMERKDKDQLELSDKKRFIEKAMEQLLPADSTVLTLFYLKEFSMEEISKITGLKTNAIKVKLHRARKRLADELSGILRSETSSILR